MDSYAERLFVNLKDIGIFSSLGTTFSVDVLSEKESAISPKKAIINKNVIFKNLLNFI